jgi:hypothetical protein
VWASKRNISDAQHGYPSSYYYTIMCITFLRYTIPWIMKVREFKYAMGQFEVENGSHSSFCASLPPSLLGRLFHGFFSFYAHAYDYYKCVTNSYILADDYFFPFDNKSSNDFLSSFTSSIPSLFTTSASPLTSPLYINKPLKNEGVLKFSRFYVSFFFLFFSF